MDDLWRQKLELNVHALNRRVDDHDNMHLNAEKRIDSVEKLVSLHEESLQVFKDMKAIAQETLEVVRPLVKALRLVGIASAWAAKVAVGSAVIWTSIKWVATKIGLVWP
jgi:hypothetical protein